MLDSLKYEEKKKNKKKLQDSLNYEKTKKKDEKFQFQNDQRNAF